MHLSPARTRWAFVFLGLCLGAPAASTPDLSKLALPDGFSISVVSDAVPNARQMALSPGGTLFVGTRRVPGGARMGEIYAIQPGEDNLGGELITLAKGLNVPNGLAYREGDLYVAELHREPIALLLHEVGVVRAEIARGVRAALDVVAQEGVGVVIVRIQGDAVAEPQQSKRHS